MSFDGIFLHAIINEIKPIILNGKVSKIYQPYHNELILRIRHQRKNYQLLLVADPIGARMQLTQEKYDNPIKAPQFLMVMRKYLERTTLVDIQQVQNDRHVIFYFSGYNELQDPAQYQLHLEIMGRHSNLILVDESNKILEVIRHIPISQNSYRTLLPGAFYKMPPTQDKINPFDDFSWPFSESPSWNTLQKTFQGLGADSAREIVWQFRTHSTSDEHIFKAFIVAHDNPPFQPTIAYKDNTQQFSAIPFGQMEGEKMPYPSLSEMLDHFYRQQQRLTLTKQRFHDLSQTLQNEIKKMKRKIVKIEDELATTHDKESYRIKGEVLTAFLHEVKAGAEFVILPNFYQDNEPLTIELAPQKTPAQNAQALFSTYQKLKNRKNYASQQLNQAQQDLAYLQSVESALYHADLEEIQEIRTELIAEGFLKEKARKMRSTAPKKVPYDEYQATDGTLIRVGKNNYQNDQLTNNIANSHHWWLHSKDIPGSHVVIVDEHPSEQTMIEAAEIAAYFSKYRQSSNVPVDITQIKNVHKPNGARPGFVTYDQQRTLFVTPIEKKVMRRKK
ncbi:Rqc2 family fibronectin-binding protein [Allofustis seminis]|uniref:Rqc2 family fibronectin-binding protein n=1 Tax=Allofustis seminis TaxID=166939 RepID=UPI00035D8274|nr:NFACT RNA binding domain-containing protein [Allofustis seminis]